MKLFQLLDKYLAVYDQIHTNREDIKDRINKNQEWRAELIALKREMRGALRNVTTKKSLYRICLDQYGKIDKHFHILYALFGKK